MVVHLSQCLSRSNEVLHRLRRSRERRIEKNLVAPGHRPFRTGESLCRTAKDGPPTRRETALEEVVIRLSANTEDSGLRDPLTLTWWKFENAGRFHVASSQDHEPRGRPRGSSKYSDAEKIFLDLPQRAPGIW